MTLSQLLALDPAAMWDALTREQQMAIVVPLLLSEFANVTAQDDGTDASVGDQHEAARIEHANFQNAMDAIGVAFSDILGDDFTALRHGPTAEMIDDTSKVTVKGMRGKRTLRTDGVGCYVRLRGVKTYIVGFKNLASEEEPVWEAWAQHHVDAERVRRHPDQMVTVVGPAPAFRSVMSASEKPCRTQSEQHDRHAA